MNATVSEVTPAPAPPQATTSVARTIPSQAKPKTVREDRGEPALADPALRFLDSIGCPMEGNGTSGIAKVEDRVRRAGIAVARLPDAAGVQERTRRERIRRLVAHAARLSAGTGAKERRHVGMAGAAVRGLRECEGSGRAARIGHVLPERIAQAPVTEGHVARLERAWKCREHVALRRRQPGLMRFGRDRRGRVEEIEILTRRDRAIVIARDDRRFARDEEREDIGRVRTVSHGVAADPELVHRAHRVEHRLERDEIGVDVADDSDLHAVDASRAARIVKRLSASARPITADLTPRAASARTSSRSRMPPPAWSAVRGPTTARTASTRSSGGPPSRASVVRSMR